MSKTLLKPCTCESNYQDKHYGKMLRLHNEAKSKTPGQPMWRCTVCGKEKT